MNFISSLPSVISLGLIWGIMAIGLYITYKVLDFADLTVDGSICTGAVVCCLFTRIGVNIWVSLLLAIIAGMLCGLITGFFHVALKIPPILSGILTQLMLWSINLKINGKANQSFSSRNFKLIVSNLNSNVAPFILLGFVVVIVGALYVFFGTEIGCAIRSTGDNEKMSKAQGINVNIMKLIGLALSNGLVALSGALLAQYQGFADINMGRGAIVIGLASIIVGTLIVSFITKNFGVQLFGCVLGAIIYYLIYQLVIFIGLDTDLLKMLSALIVAIFLGIPQLKNIKGGRKYA